jgi:AAA+ ATPase superfamily predicted ATPase
MKFYGRRRELALLSSAYTAPGSAFIPIYGRRRIGKSELIVHFMAAKPGIYYVGKQAPGTAQLREFLEVAARTLGEPLLASAAVDSWKGALELVSNRWPRGRKLVLALDEFQWMAEASPELPSVLQELWDRSWQQAGNVLLILCGSYLGFMERKVLGHGSPLFGRRTAQIQLPPFNHLEAAEFHPRYSIVDQARVYAVCGGVPMYLAAFDDRLSVEQNMVVRLLDETGVLALEPEFLLREELRDLPAYHALLMALAQGKGNPAELSRAASIESRALNYYLSNMLSLGYVQRRYPVTDQKPGIRQVRYALEDPLLRFWFRFVFPHRSLLRSLGAERGCAELVRPELEAYFGRCFERLCRESLPLLYAQEGVRAAFNVGEYWDTRTQIDVVGVRADNWTDLGECKWGAVGSITAMAMELEAKIAAYPNTRNATIGRRLFVRSLKAKGKALPQDVRLHTLAHLYAIKKVY